MGFNVLFYAEVNQPLTISNLTYNFSTPECRHYWYGRDDYHGKLVGEARDIMKTAIERMEDDGIVPNDINSPDYKKQSKDNILGDLLMWLKITYSDLMKIDDELLVMLV